ncbi:hypothetical protein [Sulfitobacter sp.]|jgi:uncharacterized membrane protein YidH (DUF202 family)|uniref:hypothetical protein n=1 Tax=Sulfitobacter sp. TaxID=1903071 RepID=UPI0039E63F64
MTDTAATRYSKLPASAVLLVVFLIASMVLTIVVGGLFPVPIWIAVAILWAVKFLYDLVRWIKADKITRPKMRFPKKSAMVLFAVVLCVVYFGYLVVTEEPW